MKLWILLALVTLNFACVAKVSLFAHFNVKCINLIAYFPIQVKVDIYYESLCPDSVRFISQQLQPLYNNFKKHLDITFIPFGKSNVSKEEF